MPKKNTGPTLEWIAERDCFYIKWFEKGNRKRQSTSTSDSALAKKKLAEFLQRQERRASGRLLDEIFASYLTEHARYVANPESLTFCIENLAPFFSEMVWNEVTPAKCQEYERWRQDEFHKKELIKKQKYEKKYKKLDKEYEIKRLSASTVRKDLAILKAALNHDKEALRIDYVPTLWLPQDAQPRKRWLRRREVAALLHAARKETRHLPWFILLSVYSAQRTQAILRLTWDRVDFDSGLIDWQYGNATNKQRPEQKMSAGIRRALMYLQKYSTPDGYVLHLDGERINSIKKSFRTAIKDASLKHATPHTLKHTAITWMMQSGVSAWEVAGFTGTSLATIEKVYGHHAPEHMEGARTSFEKARARRVTATKTATRAGDKRENMRLSA